MRYIATSIAYGRYLAQGVEAALDAGAEAIYLEEPEFWARAGWSDSFRHEWQDFYHEPWQAPDSSPDSQFRASKLKYSFIAERRRRSLPRCRSTSAGVRLEGGPPSSAFGVLFGAGVVDWGAGWTGIPTGQSGYFGKSRVEWNTEIHLVAERMPSC